MNVLDASAVLAVAGDEPGSEEALSFFDRALISSINLAEVLQKAQQRGIKPQIVQTLLSETGLGVVPFDERMAIETASLWPATRANGLSLADRACLALTAAANGLAVTTDRGWLGLNLPGIDIHLIQRGAPVYPGD